MKENKVKYLIDKHPLGCLYEWEDAPGKAKRPVVLTGIWFNEMLSIPGMMCRIVAIDVPGLVERDILYSTRLTPLSKEPYDTNSNHAYIRNRSTVDAAKDLAKQMQNDYPYGKDIPLQDKTTAVVYGYKIEDLEDTPEFRILVHTESGDNKYIAYEAPLENTISNFDLLVKEYLKEIPLSSYVRHIYKSQVKTIKILRIETSEDNKDLVFAGKDALGNEFFEMPLDELEPAIGIQFPSLETTHRISYDNLSICMDRHPMGEDRWLSIGPNKRKVIVVGYGHIPDSYAYGIVVGVVNSVMRETVLITRLSTTPIVSTGNHHVPVSSGYNYRSNYNYTPVNTFKTGKKKAKFRHKCADFGDL